MKRNVVSVAISITTMLISVAAVLSSRGTGMHALGTGFSLIIYGGIALVVAFAFALAAMIRAEEPFALTLIAFILPPLLGVIAIIRH